jgi:adsorption protein B
VACLFPPLMPVRLVWGNIINMTATLKAWKLYFWGAGAGKRKKKVAWNKTDHTFLKQPVLCRYYRNVGDVLLEKQYLDVSTLSRALKRSRAEGRRIGDVLTEDGIVTEEQLMDAVANVQHRLFIRDLSLFPAGPVSSFDLKLLERLRVYPLRASGGRYVFAAADGSPTEELPERLGLAPESCVIILSTRQSVMGALLGRDRAAAAPYTGIGRLLDGGLISPEQAVLALAHQAFTPDIAGHMGLRDASASMEPAVLTM